MDGQVIAAIIGAVATVVAVVVGWYLQRPKTSDPAPPTESLAVALRKTEDASTKFLRRYLEYPSHHRFIKALPKLRAVVRENAQEGWDTGITAEMREASYDVVDFLEYVWLRLAQFYPEKHWGGKTAEEYIRSYITDRFSFHWAKHEPDGPGTGGTIVGVLTGGDVIADVESLIADTVSAMFMYSDDFDFKQWKAEWSAENVVQRSVPPDVPASAAPPLQQGRG
jgi:hypothetical protein